MSARRAAPSREAAVLEALRAIDQLPAPHRLVRVSIGEYLTDPRGWWWSVSAQYTQADRDPDGWALASNQRYADEAKLALIAGLNDWPKPYEPDPAPEAIR